MVHVPVVPGGQLMSPFIARPQKSDGVTSYRNQRLTLIQGESVHIIFSGENVGS